MRVLLTRPRGEAEVLAMRLVPLGFTPVIEPMIEIRSLPEATVSADGVQAVVFTSANGVRALKTARGGDVFPRTLPAFAVGATTAATARAAGFRTVIQGQGTIEDLARLIVGRTPAAGAILHISGSVVARDLGTLLAPAGLAVNRAILYESRHTARLQAETRALLADGSIAAALFFSPRTAQAFVSLVADADMASSMGSVTALALSPAVADALAPLPFTQVITAARPTTDALLDCLTTLGRSLHSTPSQDD
jgi:uroporphyrinogen-III synthase